MSAFRPLLAALLLAPVAPVAASDWSGIWRYDACETGMDAWVLGAGAELVINEEDFITGSIQISPQPVAGNWHTLMTSDGTLFYLGRTEAEELVFLDLAEDAVEQFGPEVDEGRVTPETHRDIWEETIYHRCETLPPASRLLFGEVTSVMLSVDAALGQCTPGSSADDCVSQVVGALDLTGDGALNRAELSRALRAALLYGSGSAGDWILTEEATLGQIGMLPVAPVLASILLGSFDYSGDGALDAVEISADRFTLTLSEDLTASLPQGSEFGTILEDQLSDLLPFLMQLAPK